MSEEKQLVEVGVLTALAQKEENLVNGFMQLKEKIMLSACEEVQSWKPEKQEAFLHKTAVVIAKDENLKPCFESAEGKMSIIKAVHRSVSTGLEIGGIHAYLVPQGRTVKRKGENGIYEDKVIEARYSIRDRGYHALLCGGKKPIFKDLRWGVVKEKEAKDSYVDEASGEVKHIIPMVPNRGQLVGCWVQCVKMNGQKEAKFFELSKIDQWKAKAQSKNVWNAWPDEMALQASIRHFCDRYEQARELLASAIYDDETTVDTGAPIEEKVGSIIDKSLEEPEPVEIEKQEKDVTETASNQDHEPEDGTLF